MVSMIVVDTVFILTATVFLSTGGLLGRQRYGISSKYPGIANAAFVLSRQHLLQTLNPEMQLQHHPSSVKVMHAFFHT